MLNLKVLIITTLIAIIAATNPQPTRDFLSVYNEDRQMLQDMEESRSTGGSLNLSTNELEAEEIFLQYKQEELNQNSEQNPAGLHFFKAKPLITKSKIFKLLRKMPKGALLNTRTTASVSSRWIVKNIFNMTGLMKCENKDGLTIFTFRSQPEKHGCQGEYVYINEERKNASSQLSYIRQMEKLISLYTRKPELKHNSRETVWTKFQNIYATLSDVLLYVPAYSMYLKQMLKELYRDNIVYAEIRMNFNDMMYLSDDVLLPAEHSVVELLEIVEDFKLENPDFLGIKIIYSVNRNAEPDVIQKHFEAYQNMLNLFPGHIIGFDLVGQEDLGKPLYDFVNILKDKPNATDFFFHAGETNSYGASADLNLFDAVLLNTKRIGNGFSLIKHPILLRTVKSRGVAVEVSPISNQVLNLISDLRNHPGAFFLSQNIPVVICNDSPGLWNAKALSYDFYYTIMSLAPNNGGLKILKQLVWNSIDYSMLTDDEKTQAYDTLNKQWEYFIEDVLLDKHYNTAAIN